MAEYLSIHVGHAGIEIGKECWQLYCLEHGINLDGTFKDGILPDDDKFRSFFAEEKSYKFVPRALFFDLELEDVYKLRHGPYSSLFDQDNIMKYEGNGSSLFPRGAYTAGRYPIKYMVNRIKKILESYSNLQGFMIYHSLGGGTGGGVTARLLELLEEKYPKIPRVNFAVYPAGNLSSSVVEPYNIALGLNKGITDCTFMFDNEAVYDICSSYIDDSLSPTFTNINCIISQVISAITAPLRFDSSQDMKLCDLQSELVPRPKLRYPVASYAPIIPVDKKNQEQISIADMTDLCFTPSNQMIKCDPCAGKLMGCTMMYRGDILSEDVNDAIAKVKTTRKIQFSGSNPIKYNFRINSQAPGVKPGGDLAEISRASCVLSNTTALSEVLSRLSHKFNILFNKRAFFHWFKIEGGYEPEFLEARENLADLEKEYGEAAKDSRDMSTA